MVEFTKNAQKTTQFDKNKALFFPNHDIKAAVNPRCGIICYGVECVLKKVEETGLVKVKIELPSRKNHLQQLNTILGIKLN